jgi:hypothetical protein
VIRSTTCLVLGIVAGSNSPALATQATDPQHIIVTKGFQLVGQASFSPTFFLLGPESFVTLERRVQ